RTPANAPPARCCHALAYDLARGQVVLFGGCSATNADLDDTWEYDGHTWNQRQSAHRPSPRRQTRMVFNGIVLLFGGGRTPNGVPVLGDPWEWDGADWLQRTPVTSPSARWSHGLAYDFARGRTVLFGGAGSGPTPTLSDTWTWDGVDWTPVPTSSA